jgi:hypothetical protein
MNNLNIYYVSDDHPEYGTSFFVKTDEGTIRQVDIWGKVMRFGVTVFMSEVTEDNLFYRCELPVLHDEILPNNMKQDE